MTYREVIETLSNNLSTYFSEVYHSVELVTNDKGIKQPMVALGDEWISLVPTDQRETVYIRRNGDDEIYAELKLGSCEKAYQMRSSLRVVFFKDHAKNHTEILSHLMKSVLVGGTKLKSIIQNKWKLLKDESSGDYNFGATTAYFAIDIYALWNLIPDNCEEDFCVDVVNPLTCGPVAPSTTPGVPVPPVPDEDCCILLQTNSEDNSRQDLLNLVNSDTATFEYLGDGQVTVHCECAGSGEESPGPDCCPEFQTNSLINDFQEVLNLIDSDTIEVVYELDGKVSFHVIPESGEESGTENDWHILGNLDTTFGTNFLGTINNVSLEFRTNNIRSGWLDVTSHQQTSFGRFALNLSNADYNSAFGYGTLRLNITGIDNTAIGTNALENATGNDNTAVGNQALTLQTIAVNNTAIGSRAGRDGTGSENVWVGFQAGIFPGAGFQNVGVGSNTMKTFTGSFSVAVGPGALVLGSSEYNTAVGSDSLGADTVSGGNNTALGAWSLLNNSSGVSNLGLGYRAGRYNTIRSGQIYINSYERGSDDRERDRSPIYIQQTPFAAYDQKITLNGRIGQNNIAPTAWLHLNRGNTEASSSPLKFTPPIIIVTTGASGAGGGATITFASQPAIPIMAGSWVTIAGVTPAGYNGTYQVTDATLSSISYINATTGPQTVAGTISQGALLTVPEPGAMEYIGTRPYFTGSDGVRGFIPLTFIGTAAPLTTPSNIGDNFIDTNNKKAYKAMGIASSADWVLLN